MMRWILLILSCLVFGCDPRVVQCDSCGQFKGVRGGQLPGQGSVCACGGWIHKVRDLTYEDWQKAKERGAVTLSDGDAVE